jgi:DNA-binding transcriptional regulator YhcF (GntR family)
LGDDVFRYEEKGGISMEFKNKQAIYLQIADYICDQILTGKWPAGEKIISIRELAIELEVNPNTVLRTCEYLQQQDVIFNKRGIGYFVNKTAPDKIREIRRQKFFAQDLPEFIKKIQLLEINFELVTKSFPLTQQGTVDEK